MRKVRLLEVLTLEMDEAADADDGEGWLGTFVVQPCEEAAVTLAGEGGEEEVQEGHFLV
jgi:hypothetical protein